MLDRQYILDYVTNSDEIENIFDKFELKKDDLNGLNNLLLKNQNNIAMSLEKLMLLSNAKYNSFAKKSKKTIEIIWNAFRRSISLLDIITDIRLLYFASKANLLALTVIISLSLICPYIVSYSCGIKLFFINNNNSVNSNSNDGINYIGLKRIFAYFIASPLGVFYFIFLDLFDVLF